MKKLFIATTPIAMVAASLLVATVAPVFALEQDVNINADSSLTQSNDQSGIEYAAQTNWADQLNAPSSDVSQSGDGGVSVAVTNQSSDQSFAGLNSLTQSFDQSAANFNIQSQTFDVNQSAICVIDGSC